MTLDRIELAAGISSRVEAAEHVEEAEHVRSDS
jgi:hypothetical protein